MTYTDPNDYCIWTPDENTSTQQTSCGEVIEDVQIYEWGTIENCPSCDCPVLESSQ